MDDLAVDRREMLELITATGMVAGLAGCSDGGGGATTDSSGAGGGSGSGGSGGSGSGGGGGGGGGGSTETPAQATATAGLIEDTFEDGGYRTDLEWEVDLCEDCAAAVEVVEQPSPDGGTGALRLSDAEDEDNTFLDGPEAELAEPARFSAGPWTVDGRFYVDTLTSIEDYDPNRPFIDISSLTFIPQGTDTDEERNTMTLKWEGPSAGEETKVSAPALEEGTWYDYAISHDGDGVYTATRYRLDADGNRVDSVEASIPAPVPGEGANISLRVLGGHGGRQLGESPIAIDHSYIRWTDDSA
jgi:hypothetical protein